MTIQRRTVVLGIPTLVGAVLAGCGPDGESSLGSTSAANAGRITAQSISTNVASGSVRISSVYGFTVGAFPTNSTVMVPSGTLYQACVNGSELHVVLSHAASGAIRSIVLKLIYTFTDPNTGITRIRDWPTDGSTASIVMDPTDPTNLGSEGYFYNNPDVTSTSPTTSNYAYKINAGQINVTLNGSNQVVIAFSPSGSTLVKATPLTSFTQNAAWGYVYIPALGYSVSLNTEVKPETSV